MQRQIIGQFKDTQIHAELIHWIAMVNIVGDHELITRTFADDPGTVEMVCMYKVNEGKITKATFAIGQARPALAA